MKAKLVLGIICAAVLLGGCDRKGPAEQLGEEVDEAVDTIKRRGVDRDQGGRRDRRHPRGSGRRLGPQPDCPNHARAHPRAASMNRIPDRYRELLDRPIVVSLATLMSDGTPQVQPVWCSFDGTYILVNTENWAGRSSLT